ncbi:M56 family metallopeptidase [Schlesneria paludicola]|uniref:M56 family metallopeptidase n=1 Tax=Schlesneria paludicola TaxID=360056 RepID=UPI00029AF603|nr:M56 family metallopeptidase [Schlesneria paludicola]
MINGLVNLTNSLSDQWISWAFAGLLDTTALLILVSILWWTIRRRASPQVGYCLFLLVPLKLLLPISVTIPAVVAQYVPSVCVPSWFESRTEIHSPANPRLAEMPLDGPSPPEDRDPESDLAATSAERHIVLASPDPSSPSNLAKSRPIVEPFAFEAKDTVAIGPRLSVAAYVLLSWFSCTAFLLGKLFSTQCRFRKRLNQLETVEDSRLGLDLRELCRRQGVSRPVRVIVSNEVSAPSVWGIIRPTIILPREVILSLSSPQLQWVLLHELAHIHRADLLVVACQRLVAAIHFFNPAIWIANRMIHRLREYVCDDLAILRSEGSAIDSGEAFLLILRQARLRRHNLNGALGVFGLDSRAVCFARVHRLMDTDRPIRTGLDHFSLCGLVLLASIALPHIHAAQEQQPAAAPNQSKEPASPREGAQSDSLKTDQKNPTPAVPLARETGEFELTLVDAAGKPIPDATLEIRLNPPPTAAQFQQGRFIKTEGKKTFATTNSAGRLAITFPQTSTSLDIRIVTPGYAPYRAAWSAESDTQQAPAKFQAELDTGWSVGGVIVDEDGNALSGARIETRASYKNRPDVFTRTTIGTIATTDEAGKWRFDSVQEPVGLPVDIDHPDFMPMNEIFARRDSRTENGREITERKIRLQCGLTVRGKVIDEKGNPIVQARVFARVASYHIRQVMTETDGTYKLPGCATNTTRIVVFANGRAPEAKDVLIEPAMTPVDFQMQPGAKIRVKILDEADKPIPMAHLIFRGWRGTSFGYFEFDQVNRHADEQGIWEWDAAPLDEFQADICRPNGLCLAKQTLKARDEEYVFRLPAALVVVGKVIDAETKTPVKSFVVTTGNRFDNGSAIPSDRLIIGRAKGSDGSYRIEQTEGVDARRNVNWVQVESNGYRLSDWREVKFDLVGTASVDFELTKSQNVPVTPIGTPIPSDTVSSSNALTSEATTAISLPAGCISALKHNVDALKACTLAYSQHREYVPLPEGERDNRPTQGVDGYTVLDDGRIYHRRIFSNRAERTRSDGTLRPNYEEYAFDGQVFYLGSPGLGRGHVTKFLGENRDSKEAQTLTVHVYYLEAAGFQLPRSFADWRTSTLDSSILKAAAEGKINKLTEEGSILTLEMEVPDQTVLIARKIDLEAMKREAETRGSQLFKDNQFKLIDLYRKVAAREPWRKTVIKLDRQKGYALRHQTDETLDGKRIQTIDCEEFEHFPQQQIWLPRRCIERDYTRSPFFLQDFTDEPELTTQIKLDSIAFTKPDEVSFKIDYGPGSRVTDRSRPTAEPIPKD